MSTILEALKRSEQERKLNNIPTLSDMPTPTERSRLPAIVITALIVMVIACVVFFVGFKWFNQNDDTISAGGASVSIREPQSAPSNQPSSDLSVNVISFSKESGQSFAMINGKMYRESEFIRAGIKLEMITVDSVVLNQRGKKITLRP